MQILKNILNSFNKKISIEMKENENLCLEGSVDTFKTTTFQKIYKNKKSKLSNGKWFVVCRTDEWVDLIDSDTDIVIDYTNTSAYDVEEIVNEWKNKEGQSTLFLNCISSQSQTVKGENTKFVDSVLNDLISGPYLKGSINVVIDGLGRLNKVSNLKMILTAGKSKNICVQIGIQDKLSVESLYSRIEMLNITANTKYVKYDKKMIPPIIIDGQIYLSIKEFSELIDKNSIIISKGSFHSFQYGEAGSGKRPKSTLQK